MSTKIDWSSEQMEWEPGQRFKTIFRDWFFGDITVLGTINKSFYLQGELWYSVYLDEVSGFFTRRPNEMFPIA